MNPRGTTSAWPVGSTRLCFGCLIPADPISLDHLAAHTGLDKFHLCRAFRAQVGLPPHSYLAQLRIARAKQLLIAGVKPSDIAPRIGMYDQSQLNRHFRRIVGTTPAR